MSNAVAPVDRHATVVTRSAAQITPPPMPHNNLELPGPPEPPTHQAHGIHPKPKLESRGEEDPRAKETVSSSFKAPQGAEAVNELRHDGAHLDLKKTERDQAYSAHDHAPRQLTQPFDIGEIKPPHQIREEPGDHRRHTVDIPS